MTVSSTISRSGPYNGNGVTTVFDYDFRILEDTHLTVVRTVDGVDAVVNPSDYSVGGVGNADGGSITFTLAPAAGQTITIIRNAPFTQELDLQNQGEYYAEDVERGFDLAAMRDQQLEERLDRTIQIPVGADPSVLPGMVENIVRLTESVENIDTVADNMDAVNTVAPHAATITESVAEIVTVATNVTDVNTVADNIASVNTLAPLAETITDNLSDIHNFADVYQGAKASDPVLRNDGSALQAGDLYFNSGIDLMKVYTGSEWRDASSQSLNMVAESSVGDGAETDFLLAYDPGVAANVLVWVGGVRQRPIADYTISGSVITFSNAPGSGVPIDTLIVATISTLNIPADGSVSPLSISLQKGSYWVDQGAMNPAVYRLPERLFLDDGALYRGAWNPTSPEVDGLTLEAFILHNWGPRDASIYVDSRYGAMAIVGHSQASKRTGWPGLPTYTPAAIGVSGFSINDVTSGTLGQGWGLYGDAVRFPGAGFTVGAELAIANLGDFTNPTPANLKLGPVTTVGAWVQSGGGLDAVAYAGQFGAINHAHVGLAFVSSFADDSTRFGAGIMFGQKSLVGTDGVSGEATAIGLGRLHVMQWYNTNGEKTSRIVGSVANVANSTVLSFSDVGMTVAGIGNETLLRIPRIGSAVDHLLLTAGGAGAGGGGRGAVTIEAEGDSANIDLHLKGKGSGLVRFGASAAASSPPGFTADRYLFIRDNAGNALAIPCRTSGW